MGTQTLDLNKMGLVSMTEKEIKETDGGGFWSKVLGALTTGPVGVVFAVAATVDAFSEFIDGANAGVVDARK